MIRYSCLMGLALLIPLAAPAAAQVSAELRGGAAIGNHAPAASGLETRPGLALAGSIEYRAVDYASLYVSFSRASFGCEDGFCTDRDATITAQGFGAGVRLHPRSLPWPWVRAGILFHETSVDAGDQSGSVPAGPGVELGTGVTIPITARVGLSPGLYLRTQSGDDRTTVLGADVGVHVRIF